MDDAQFQAALQAFGRLLLDDGPSVLKFLVKALLVFPKNTVAYRLGLKLQELIALAGLGV